MDILDAAILWIHLFSAIIFIGGSFFIWLVLWPASFDFNIDEKERTRVIGKVAKRFAWFTHITLIVLIITGIYNVTWYLPNLSDLFTTPSGELLFIKSLTVLAMIVIMYGNNIYHGKKIVKLASEGKLDEVKKIRKMTHKISALTLALMILITIEAVGLQFLG